MKKSYYLLGVFFLLVFSCGSQTPQNKKQPESEKSQYVLIETTYGNIKLKLYNETPVHRDNFIALVTRGFYDSLLFHRVINGFMIQGGDPDSKHAALEKMLGDGGPGYDLEAEFVPTLFHKKGALAAAREPDNVNPQKRSSGSQFYIVQGTVFTTDQLKQMEDKINFPKRKELVFNYVEKQENAALKHRLDSLKNKGAYAELNQAYSELAVKLEPEYQKLNLFHYSSEQIQSYITLGGTPHLDQNYTVFGEVVEGLAIVDSIARVKTNKNDRPLSDVLMKMHLVE